MAAAQAASGISGPPSLLVLLLSSCYSRPGRRPETADGNRCVPVVPDCLLPYPKPGSPWRAWKPPSRGHQRGCRYLGACGHATPTVQCPLPADVLSMSRGSGQHARRGQGFVRLPAPYPWLGLPGVEELFSTRASMIASTLSRVSDHEIEQ